MKHRLLILLILLIANSPVAFAQVTTEPIPCGLRIQATPVKNAASYSFRRLLVNYCTQIYISQMGSHSLGSSSLPTITLDSAPAFNGFYRVDVFSAEGILLETQSTPLLLGEPDVGRFWHPGAAYTIDAIPGEQLPILLGYAVPPNATVEWLRNGEVVQSGTSPDLTWTVTGADDNAIFMPRVYGACGPSDGFARLVRVYDAPSSTIVAWEGARHIGTVTQQLYGFTISSPCPFCTVPVTTRTEQSFPNAGCVAIAGDSFSTSCGVSIGSLTSATSDTRIQVTLLEPARLQISGINRLPSSIAFGYCGSITGGISGPVSLAFPTSVGAWGPLQVNLVPGRYVISARGAAGAGCASTGSMVCSGFAGMELHGTLTSSALRVPQDFSTVQSAIDAIPHGEAGTILIAPGTYNQSFSLNGKNVIIRGAADGSTILDGTGLPASICRLSGNEPATAGLENLVFRNGSVGSIIYDGAPFKVGGAVYGVSSSAFIRNCRFESNCSDYGGGAYLLYCNMLVEGCVFTSNTGVSQGGGLMVFGTTGTVRNCAFTGNQCGVAGIGGGSAFKAAGALNTGETVTFDGCTVSNNTAGVEGGAVEYYENVELHPGTLRIVNSTITGNRSGTGVLAGAGGLMITGRMQSVVIDSGTTLCGNLPRNVKGAFFIAGSPTICDCLADLNGDGAVGSSDLVLLMNSWESAEPSGAGDVNHDGQADGADLSILLSSWGPCP
jgi:hypothetical protein